MTAAEKMALRAKKYDLRLLARREKDAIRQARLLERAAKKEKKRGIFKTASHLFMAGIMLMYFVGVGLGVYVTIVRGEHVGITLDYIMRLALIVGLGYFAKAFGENIAKIILPFIFGRKHPDSKNDGGTQGDG
jgi:hypothetical protein